MEDILPTNLISMFYPETLCGITCIFFAIAKISMSSERFFKLMFFFQKLNLMHTHTFVLHSSTHNAPLKLKPWIYWKV